MHNNPGDPNYLDGDGNGDRIVDISGADYVHWFDSLGAKRPVNWSSGDYDDNEVIDQRDYELWKATWMSTTDLRADVDGDGIVNDSLAYVFWFDALGEVSAWSSGPTSGTSTAAVMVDFTAAPQVLNVTISGSTSTHDPYSFADEMTDPGWIAGNQLTTVPVGGADTVSITFSEDVYVEEGDLKLRGLTTGAVPNIAEFSYDMTTATATWRFDNLVANDVFVITLDDAVTDVEGNLLDGDWVNPSSITTTNTLVSEFPSGDGIAGGDFNFAYTLLAGDLDGNNLVDMTDFVIFSGNFGILTEATFYVGDQDGDGDVDIDDYFVFVPNGAVDLQTIYVLMDLNGDNQVDFADLDLFNDNWEAYDAGTLLNPTESDGDFDGDGDIDVDDDALRAAFAWLGLNWAA